MDLSINPTYLCNFRCKFCYLTKEQLGDKSRLDLDVLRDRLCEVERHEEITHIDLYGGEISVLPEDYVNELISTIRDFYSGHINVVTNLSKIHPSFLIDDNIDLSVSYDWICRERHMEVFSHMIMCPKPIHVLMLASECLVEQPVEDIVKMFNAMSNIVSVEIKPYSPNQSNIQPVSYNQYEEFVKQWFEYDKNFEFVNEKYLDDVVSFKRNAFSDDHVYITPSGDFAVLEFDLNDNEYFKELNTFDEYLDWTYEERNRVISNPICDECPYLGRCLSEHLRDVKDISESCNGFRHLIEWYEQTRTQD